MRINFKQEELIEKLMNDIRQEFPEVELIDVTESPESPETLWLNVTTPKDEDRDMALIEFAGDKLIDILLDYGYHMLIMPSETALPKAGKFQGIKMRINFKQEELIEKLMDDIRQEFPEVELIDVTESPEGHETLWINMTAPEDEDREIKLRRFGSEKATDILLDYGYHMLVMPRRKSRRKENLMDREILMAA